MLWTDLTPGNNHVLILSLYQLFYRMISCNISVLSSDISNEIILYTVQSRPHMRVSWICQHHQETNRENSWRGSALEVLGPGTCDVSHQCFFFTSCTFWCFIIKGHSWIYKAYCKSLTSLIYGTSRVFLLRKIRSLIVEKKIQPHLTSDVLRDTSN